VEASRSASVSAPQHTQVQTVTLSAKEAPAKERVYTPGEVTVTETPSKTATCEKTYTVRSLVVNARPSGTLLYGWRLVRWSAATHSWRTYLTSNSGFTGESQLAEWSPRVVDNPGWYRVELRVTGAKPLASDRFMLSC
jgi:hypothetical protein